MDADLPQAHFLPQEARADVLLPPGATCHAVSLWINGKEMPAAFGAPQKVRQAYQEVAVVQKRDPLLVTMPAPGHLLVQCFPVPVGGDMKIKLAVTLPLTWREFPPDKPGLQAVFPAFGPVNFDVPNKLVNDIRFSEEGSGGIGWLRQKGNEIFSPFRVGVNSSAFRRDEPRVGDELAPGVRRAVNPLAPAPRPVDVWVLLDASRGMNDVPAGDVQTALVNGIAGLPEGSRIFIGDTQTKKFTEGGIFPDTDQFRYNRFVGGTDPAPALQNALLRAHQESQANGHASAVVFLHAASPGHVSNWDTVRRELHLGLQAQEKTGTPGPVLVGVPLTPRAPDAVAMDLAGFTNVYSCRALPGDVAAVTDAVGFAARAASASETRPSAAGEPAHPLGGKWPAVNGIVFTGGDGLQTRLSGRSPLARLHQAGLTTEAWYRANAVADASQALDVRIAGGRPAAQARLVTPLTSAVVLETREQYERYGLNPDTAKKRPPLPPPAPLPMPPKPPPAAMSIYRNPQRAY